MSTFCKIKNKKKEKQNTMCCVCANCGWPVGHVQFGEEEVSTGCGWNPSTGWSADKPWAGIHAALCVPRVRGECTWGLPQGAESNLHMKLSETENAKSSLNTRCSHFQSKGLPKQSVPGCVRNFKMNGAPMINPTTNRGAGPCLEGQTQKGAYFAGNRAHVIISKYHLITSIFNF